MALIKTESGMVVEVEDNPVLARRRHMEFVVKFRTTNRHNSRTFDHTFYVRSKDQAFLLEQHWNRSKAFQYELLSIEPLNEG